MYRSLYLEYRILVGRILLCFVQKGVERGEGKPYNTTRVQP